MKKFKLPLIVLLVVLIAAAGCFCLAACNDNDDYDDDTVLVGVYGNIPKFGQINAATGRPEGFEIDLAKAVLNEMNYDDIRFVVITESQRLSGLDSKSIDMVAASLTITEDRKQNYNITASYHTDYVSVLVSESTGYNSLSDFKSGDVIGVASGTSTVAAIKKQITTLGLTGVTVREFYSKSDLFAALENGEIKGMTSDMILLSPYVKPGFKLVTDKFAPQNYGIATRRSDREFSNKANSALNKLISNGKVTQLKTKWNVN